MLPHNPRRLFFLLTLLLLAAGCSQNTLLTKQDYQKSQNQFVQGNADDAFLDFPRRAEVGDFITTMENAYLNLIQGKPQVKLLQQQVDALENRVRYHVSREAKTFFYLQTAEDYYASEHEIIWLHFLLSWAYSLQGKYENACVEARVARSLLSLPWSPSGHFARRLVYGQATRMGTRVVRSRTGTRKLVCGAGRPGAGSRVDSGNEVQSLALQPSNQL
jgi:hypothetical protein